MDEEQTGDHGSEHGCTTEPHENICLGLCLEAHDVCDPSEEEEVALMDAVEAADLSQAVALMKSLKAQSRWNENRGALQVFGTCSGQVVLHLPIEGKVAEWLRSLRAWPEPTWL